MELSLSAQLESLLFWKGEPVSLKELVTLSGADEAAVLQALEALKQQLETANRGIVLLSDGTSYELATHAAMGEKIEALNKEELTKDLSKAALETLSIIMYRGPLKRSEIDYIRGVNSQFILRTLSVRGLINRLSDPKDDRAYVYGASLELLEMLGVTDQKALPDYEAVNADIEGFMSQQEDDTPTPAPQETAAPDNQNEETDDPTN